MGLGPFNPGADCCCEIATDDFNREDDTDIGAAWREVSGDWYIDNDHLEIDEGFTSAWLAVPVADDTSYWALEADPGDDSNCGTLRFWFSTNSSIDLIPVITVKDLVPDQWHTLSMCHFKRDYPELSYYIFKVTTASGVVRWIKHYEEVHDSITPDVDGWTTGLGSGSAFARHLSEHPDGTGDFAARVRFMVPSIEDPLLPVEFDDFYVARSQDDEEDHCCPNCHASCSVWSDNFNRENSTDIGCEWEEISGNPEIADERLYFPDAAEVRGKVPHSTYQDGNAIIEVALEAEDGETIRVYITTNEDGDYIYGDVTLGASGSVVIGENIGGVDNVLESLNGDFGPGVYRLCITPEQMLFRDPDGASAVTTESIPSQLLYPGLASTGEAAFDNFFHSLHHSDEFPECSVCNTRSCSICKDDLMPGSLIVQFGGTLSDYETCNPAITPTCDDMNGLALLISTPLDLIGHDCCLHEIYPASGPFVTPVAGCGMGMEIQVHLDASGGDYELLVKVKFSNQATTININDFKEYIFRKTYTSRPDCLHFANEDVPFESVNDGGGFDSFPHCEWTDPAITVDAA